MSDQKNKDWKPIAISLPARYWITVFAITEKFVEGNIRSQIEKLKKQGTKLEDVPDEIMAALMGPVFARGAIVDALCDAKIMKPEVKAKLGTDTLMKMAKEYHDKKRKGNGFH